MTDDVKALIEEARRYTRLEQATVVNHDTTHALICLCDRLAAALSDADARPSESELLDAIHYHSMRMDNGAVSAARKVVRDVFDKRRAALRTASQEQQT